MVDVLLAELAEASRVVSQTSARLAKVAALAGALRAAGAAEVPVLVAYLSGELPQRQIGVGWAALRSVPPPAETATLTLLAVDEAMSGIKAVGGKGSATERKRLVGELFAAATAEEQFFLVRLLSGELRQGALDGVMTDAVARAAGVPGAEVRRAVMLSGSLAVAAQAALSGGSAALARFGLQVGRPLKPMLAASEASLADALAKAGAEAGDGAADAAGSGSEAGAAEAGDAEAGVPSGAAAIEWKLDGIRVQAHLADTAVRLFTRSLDDITDRLPEVVAALAALPVRNAVFDGELIALRPDGRPYAFQDTASRAASDVDALNAAKKDAAQVALSVFLFDVLHLDGTDLLDRPDAERHAALAAVVPEAMLMPRLVTADEDEAAKFFRDAVARGHEGVVVKSLVAPYAAGRRGAGWIKVKPRHTLDLVVLAVEWGHGRRKGWLSNLHLGARDPETDGWVMLGKTFKGLTDELLTWQTARFQELEDHRDDWTVYVRPEQVVEIAFDGVQRSPRYPGGVALRFARVLRYRPDKTAAEADTIDTVKTLALPTD
jgi:ATP-dependent DNA ligase I